MILKFSFENFPTEAGERVQLVKVLVAKWDNLSSIMDPPVKGRTSTACPLTCTHARGICVLKHVHTHIFKIPITVILI